MKATPDNVAANWFDSPVGGRVQREESALARVALDDVFGFELLQVGCWGPARHMLHGARTQHTTLLAPAPAPGVTLCAPLTSLPFASDSIDAVMLPHTLELVQDPYAVLREAERVLCAEGCLMICGFNPWSGWGARRLFGPLFRRRRRFRLRRSACSPSGGCATGWRCSISKWTSVYGYLGPLPLTRRPRKLADGTLRQAEYRARRPDRRRVPAQGAQARADPDPGAPEAPLAPAGAGAGGGTDPQVGSNKCGSMTRWCEIYTDGACRGNPGPGGWAAC